MKVRNTRWGLMALATCAALLSTTAHATWTFDTTGTKKANATDSTPGTNTGTYTYYGSNVGDATVSLTGFYVANTTTSGTLNQAWKSSAGNVGTASKSNSAKGVISHGSWGIGMYTGTDKTEPQHALDNSQFTESVLLSFTSSTVLTSIGLGYVQNTASPVEFGCRADNGVVTAQTSGPCAAGTSNVGATADISLFRWTGDEAPTVAGTAAGSMAGWELVGNYGDMVYDKVNPYNAVNAAGKTSSWWLISAYNSGFTQSTSGGKVTTENRSTLTNGDDFFKLYAVAGTKCAKANSQGVCGGSDASVPEPATLALASVALLGVAGLRRRQAKTAA